ncbi:hypothetical protein ACJEQC_25845, partial [Klebsiella pneumoniae]
AYCLKTQPATGETYPKSDLFNKALEEHKRNEARLSVYHRLRYVEADNIVFDPQSMKGCYAERKFIASLVESCITK